MKYVILATALLPVAILLLYIYWRDRRSPEPLTQLTKALFFGLLTVPISLSVSIPLQALGYYTNNPQHIFDCVQTAFFGAAIPEEGAKFLMLWLLLRKSRHFDERMDGIVYAVCISLGFAALENIMYLFENRDTYLTVGISRALFAVPGHFCFGILMGYYYSIAKFYPRLRKKYTMLAILAPILAHGIYDAILFITEAVPLLSILNLNAFLAFCVLLWIFGHKRIKAHLIRDRKIADCVAYTVEKEKEYTAPAVTTAENEPEIGELETTPETTQSNEQQEIHS
ncbi:MAG: PrsW family intramembrane metalloprotease [Bacteroidaceae bacterium]|nr:PrsW family intramembrane metalloprotease [Bacteroidaceae bacterium]